MELDDQLCGILVEEGVRPTTMREIRVDVRVIKMWRGMARDMLTLMRHIIGATKLLAWAWRVGQHRQGGDEVR